MFTDIVQNRFFQAMAVITIVGLCIFGYNYNTTATTEIDSDATINVATIDLPAAKSEQVSNNQNSTEKNTDSTTSTESKDSEVVEKETTE